VFVHQQPVAVKPGDLDLLITHKDRNPISRFGKHP
jgi:hypothetical protein